MPYDKYEDLILYLEDLNITIDMKYDENNDECKNLIKIIYNFNRLPNPFKSNKTIIINYLTYLLDYYDNLKYLKTMNCDKLIEEKNKLGIFIDLNSISNKKIKHKIKKISKVLDIIELKK